jgi:oligopeptide/dipeptide ABC transporter ATP-binding protein
MTPALEWRNLVKHYPARRGRGVVSAVEDVSLAIEPGETLGLVGESGSGKTTVATIALRLVEPTSGSVLFHGEDVFGLSGEALRRFRRETQLIFQDPYSSLDPLMNVRQLITEPLVVQRVGDRASRAARADELLELVGLPARASSGYPHQFSGGQRQRIVIARALALQPTLLVCDEAVSALDVSIRAQILNLLKRLQRELGLTYLFIAHDMSVIRFMSDQVAVMYLGKLVEIGSRTTVLGDPRHPYTLSLLSSVQRADPDHRPQRIVLRGDIPSALDPPPGCRFHTRCPIAQDLCRVEEPPLRPIGSDRLTACHFAEDSTERVRAGQPQLSASASRP